MPLLMPLVAAFIESAPQVAVAWMPSAPPSTFLRPLAALASPASPASTDAAFSINWTRMLLIGYLLVTAVFLIRILVGLLQSRRVRNAAVPLREDWTSNSDVRASDKIRLPATVGSTILFPTDWVEWSVFERTSVFLHESAHARRKDFHVYALAGVHRAIFWFNPLSWWLERHLIEVAEAICDDAAIRQVEDRVSYAELLVRLTGRASRGEVFGVAMARGKTITRRVERVLRETRIATEVSWLGRGLIVTALVPLVTFAAGSWLVETRLPAPAVLPIGTVFPQAASSRQPVTPQQTPSVTPTPPVSAPSSRQPVTPQQTPSVTPTPPVSAPPAPAQETKQFLTPWPEVEVPDIIGDEERSAFNKLRTDEEREQFIAAFWMRRDPTPGTVNNEFKEMYYIRVVLANQRFTTNVPGWKTDRGRILIKFGEPDEIETHATGRIVRLQGGTTTTTLPFERWRYRSIEGIGNNVILEFVDSDRNGTYRLEFDPRDLPSQERR
jgi:GWxTD domain-containing protein